MNDEALFYTITRLTKVVIGSKEKYRIITYFASIENNLTKQKKVFEYCLQWKLAPWIFLQLKKHELDCYFESDIIILFKEEYTKIELQNKNRNEKAIKFLELFKKRGVDVAILKGNLFANTFYGDIGYKRMNDFDILIHATNWVKAQIIYEELNYIPLGFGWAGEKQKPANFSHVGTPFISSDFSCIVGTQWGIKSPTARYRVAIDEVWKHVSDFDFHGITVKKLSPEFNLVHLVLHMGLYKCGIRDLMDVYNLYISHSFNEDTLVKLFEEANATDKAYFTLKLSNICSDVIDTSLLEKLKPKSNKSFVSKRLVSRVAMIEKTKDFHRSYNDYFQDVEKLVIYFNLYHQFHKKIYFYGKILKSVFFPKLSYTMKFCDKDMQSSLVTEKIVARIKAPYYIFSLIAEEIGWKYTILLFFKLFVDLVVSVWFYIFPKESYFQFLVKKNISGKQIQKCVQNVQ